MSDEPKTTSKRGHKKLWTLLIVLALVLAALFIPPFISIARYKARITGAMARSLGRTVKLSSVELVLLPRPGFELHDLVVDEDPAFGAEPVLHANTVEASIRLWSLWRGKLEISRISVDEASLNLVRTAQGRWNVDALFRNATNNAGQSFAAGAVGQSNRTRQQLPTLVATNSRINFKRGVEKLPFSLSNAELNLSSSGTGSWDLTLRGQPVRTDLPLSPGDTGEIRMNATFHNAPELRQMPIKLELEWRKAQLGQLTRLLLGADAGWRGDLTGNLTLEGTAGDAQVKSRLRATNVHRVEFAPNAPLDFDANCAFAYHSYERSLDNLVCDSPLGSGEIHLTGRLQGKTDQTSATGTGTAFSFEIKNLPAAAGLDTLRTLRASLLPGIEAKGLVNGKLNFIDPTNSAAPATKATKSSHKTAPIPSPLSGSFTIEGFELSGGALKQPLKVQKIELSPIPAPPGQTQALEAKIPLQAGESAPLFVDIRIERHGYRISALGSASVARTLEFSQALGFSSATDTPTLSGGSVTADLSAEGPWIEISGSAGFAATPDKTSGTATLHNTKLTADALMNPVEIASATLRLDPSGINWDDVNFTYGTLKGTATFSNPCATPCGNAATTPQPKSLATILNTASEPAHFTLKFDALDANTIQASLLGAHDRGTMLSNLLARLKPEKQLSWPKLQGTIQAESILFGPVTLTAVHMDLALEGAKATITNLDASLLGGSAHASGSYEFTGNKPHYELTIATKNIKPSELSHLFSDTLSGSPININGQLKLTGFTSADLTSSATGTLHFDWKNGSLITATTKGAANTPIDQEKSLSHFDHWTGDATISSGTIILDPNQLTTAKKSTTIDATIPLTTPTKLIIATPKPIKQ